MLNCRHIKLRHMLNSSERVLYARYRKFSLAASQWIKAETVKVSIYIKKVLVMVEIAEKRFEF